MLVSSTRGRRHDHRGIGPTSNYEGSRGSPSRWAHKWGNPCKPNSFRCSTSCSPSLACSMIRCASFVLMRLICSSVFPSTPPVRVVQRTRPSLLAWSWLVPPTCRYLPMPFDTFRFAVPWGSREARERLSVIKKIKKPIFQRQGTKRPEAALRSFVEN